MKTPQLLRSVAAAGAMAAIAVMIAGCATSSADRAANISQTVTQTGKTIEASRQAITQCMTSLNQLTTPLPGDLRSQYKDYLASVKSLTGTTDKMDASVNGMMDASHIYFADWENQIAVISDPAIKQMSLDRKQQATISLADLKKAIDQNRAAYKPLEKELNDVGVYLGNNLTSDGIAAIKPRLDDIKKSALAVRDSLADSAAALGKYSATLSAPPPAKK
jgi:hypothetical protein